jgi:hypothetical protein
MSKVAKVAVSLLLTVCGKPKTQSHIRLIREKAPLLPLAAAWTAFALASSKPISRFGQPSFSKITMKKGA